MKTPTGIWRRPKSPASLSLSQQTKPRAMRVRVRVKGAQTEGAIYQGTKMIQPCKNCKKR